MFWRLLVLVALVLASGIGPVAAQGKPDKAGGGNGGGPGSGETCYLMDANGDLYEGTATVVLDPGHGGGDPGAIDPFHGQRESDLNLEIAFIAMGQLQNQGVSVALTRYDDVALENSQRGAIANACGASVFIEIHLNASSDPTMNYSQAFWGKKRKDLDFANHMAGYIGPLTGDGRVGQFANGGLLHAEMPAVLTENVFLTNETEANALLAGTRQHEIAAALVAGILAWPDL